MPEERLMTLPGYSGDVKQNREKARELMKKAGYGPDKHLHDQAVDPQHPGLSRPARFCSIS